MIFESRLAPDGFLTAFHTAFVAAAAACGAAALLALTPPAWYKSGR